MYRTTVLCLLAACGASSLQERPGPRGLRADQHLTVAARESDRAHELTHWPALRSVNDPPETALGLWFGTWDTVTEHEHLALVHRSAAAEIEAEYEQACGDTLGEVASVSPLRRYALSGSEVPGGTLVVLSSDAGPPDQLLSAMRCHRAWMMLGRSDMEQCPLDLPGLHISARGEAGVIELTVTVSDPALVDELRRRAAHDVEAAQREHEAPR
jgi:hypothetical protein